MKKIERKSAETLLCCGWTVTGAVATRRVGDVKLTVRSDLTWQAAMGRTAIASGVASHIAYAAMEANEYAWARRAALAVEAA